MGQYRCYFPDGCGTIVDTALVEAPTHSNTASPCCSPILASPASK